MNFLPKYQYKLRTRIYLSMIMLLVGSFFFIGVFTYYNFKKQNQNYHDKRLLRKETATISSISHYIKSQGITSNLNPSIKDLFKLKVLEWNDIHRLDINIYDLNGDLIVCSDKKLVEDRVIAKKIDEEILKQLSISGKRIKRQFSHEDLDYLNSYQYIFDINQAPIAVISIPYFELNESYKRDLRSYLFALSPVYLLLFIIASFLAFLLARQITDPMLQLSKIMKRATYKKRYIPLKWSSSDEIGQLVKQYNYMGKELEKNSIALAKNEKESAWKEMAKQVAHEIKNPLTPMKLSIQYFERLIDPKSPDFNKKIKKFTTSMVEQIDALANIASTFSNFALMPSGNKECINLTEILESTVFLYQPINIKFVGEKQPIYIYAENNQLISVFNNLINNAIEATKENMLPEITIKLETKINLVILQFSDLGKGIPLGIKDKVFEPKFTTKNSGMGLGLAMVKHIINDLNGDVSFESNEKNGTTFSLSIPILEEKI